MIRVFADDSRVACVTVKAEEMAISPAIDRHWTYEQSTWRTETPASRYQGGCGTYLDQVDLGVDCDRPTPSPGCRMQESHGTGTSSFGTGGWPFWLPHLQARSVLGLDNRLHSWMLSLSCTAMIQRPRVFDHHHHRLHGNPFFSSAGTRGILMATAAVMAIESRGISIFFFDAQWTVYAVVRSGTSTEERG